MSDLASALAMLQAMTAPIRGGCLCGRVTYTCHKAPVWSVNCHCHECQQLSGAPYVSAFSVPASSFEATGETVAFTRTASAGHIVTTTHCASCGSRVYAQSSGAKHLMNVFASTLADKSSFVAISNVYLSEAAPWVTPPDAPFNFQKMPQR
jgi:hypothetical protein